MRRRRTGWLTVALLLRATLPAAAGEDVFTPLTAVPFNPATTPVPGTDGKWHLVYELRLANVGEVPATLEGVQVTDVPGAEEAARRARLGLRGRSIGLLPDRGGRPPQVLAEFGADAFPERLRGLYLQPAENAEIGVNAARLFLVDLALAPHEPAPTQLRHVLELTGQRNLFDPEPAQQRYAVATVAVTRRLPVLRPPLRGTGWVAFNGCCGPDRPHRSTPIPVNGRLHYHRWGEVRLVVRKPTLLAPVGELRGQAELAGVRQIGQQRQVLGQERPMLAKLVHRPQPPHRPTLSSLGTGSYGLEADFVISDGQNAQLRGHWAISSDFLWDRAAASAGRRQPLNLGRVRRAA
jgi:hypothetical protein